MEKDEEMHSLVVQRGQIKGQVTRFMHFVEDFDSNKLIELKVRLDKIDQLWAEFNNIQSNIELLDDSKAQLDYREAFEISFFSVLSRAKQLLSENTPSSSEKRPSNNETRCHNIKLPVICIPTFHGDYREWPNFYDTFNALVHSNNSLSNAQKYHYLRDALKGDAKLVIESLEVSESNYNTALDLLKARFDNKKLIKRAHVASLFNITALTKESHHELRRFVDDLNKHLRALKNLGESVETWDALLIHLITTKLDPITKREWESFTAKLDDPKVINITTFLTDRCNILETLNTDFNKTINKTYNKRSSNRSLVYVSSQDEVKTLHCTFCKESHFICNCQNFLKLPVKARYTEAKRLRLCTNCLRSGHFNSMCRSSTCKICHKRHNSLLHLDYENTDNVEPNIQPQSNISQSPEDHDVQNLGSINNHSANKQESHVLLSTAIIHIRDSRNKLVRCRALLDSGSQSSFMTRELFEKLHLSTNMINLSVTGIGQSVTKIVHRTEAVIESLHNAYHKKLSFLILDKITENAPVMSIAPFNFDIPGNITLADPTFNIAGKIDILLGAEVFWELLCVGQINIGKGKPILQKSKFGWLVSGPVSFISRDHTKTTCNMSFDQHLQNQIEKFWKVEECYTQGKFSEEELQCEKIFAETTIRDHTGRFITTLPLRDSIDKLGDSQNNAMVRFLSLEKRFERDINLKQKYVEFINDYKALGHMTEIVSNDIESDNSIAYYLPHHGVLKESSSTTKLRVVFDASCKTSTNVSLNDILMVGPTIQEDLFSILLRFRKHNIVIISDIAKMYRQVLVSESQRDLQRIIWRSNSKEPLQHYRLNTLTYGTSPASFIAIRCLHQLAYENMADYPLASKVIIRDFYVDDLITGADTVEKTIKVKQDVENILEGGGFQLRKWISNNDKVLDNLISHDHDISQYYISDGSNIKTLGLMWNAKSDIIQVTTHTKDFNRTVTKRIILSTISQIFDPLGLVGPIIIKAKIILQLLWQLRIDWDESVPIDIYTEWINLRDQINLLTNLQVPRHIVCVDPIHIQIHGFCDASMVAYGVALYMRSIDSEGNVLTRLICAKSRVAPLKCLTLPRLELCGALLLAQLTQKVISALSMKISNTFYWCDSSIVIAWLSAPSNKWKTFVSNRVAEIQHLTHISDWHHISSFENPADIISRGVTPAGLIHSKLWWSGPTWLSENSNKWPISLEINVSNIPESKTSTLVVVTAIDQDLFIRYSSLTKLQHVVAYCLRFKHNSNNKASKLIGMLTQEELTHSMKTLIKMSQIAEFSRDLQQLKKFNTVSRHSKLNSLNAFIDCEGIIRVGGRISKSDISIDQKHPVVLSNKHPLTKLIIAHEHLRNFHSGPQATLASLRRTFWPLKGRSTVKKILRECVICFKVKPTSIFPQMGDLPKQRLQPVRPFYTCGIDYSGPFYIKDGKIRNRKIIKCWLCIFVCFVTKACHLELVGDLTTECFLNALKRFTSRRGICKDIYSDNGTNFTGANNELKEVEKLLSQIKHESNLSHFLNLNKIRWHFIPARSPHLGGLWEAAVKAAKFHLKRIVGNAHLTFEDLSTVFTQIEAILNSRPLTPMSEDPNDLIPLTPSHFLIGDVLTSVPQLDVKDIPTNRLSHYQRLQQIIQHFWNRWSSEYLSTLQERNKWKFRQHSNLKIGSMVLLKSENAPPMLWPLGRIVELHPGEDGVLRVVSVKTVTGVVKRSVTKVCVLPIDLNVNDNVPKDV